MAFIGQMAVNAVGQAAANKVVEKVIGGDEEPGLEPKEVVKVQTKNAFGGVRVKEIEGDMANIGPVKLGNFKAKGDAGLAAEFHEQRFARFGKKDEK